jgi:segregation and condensation protein B
VKGNLPQEKEKEKEREPVQKPGFLRSVELAQNGALMLEALVESLLFVADGPVPVARMAEALEVTPREVEAALTALGEVYAATHRGLSLQRFRDKVQLTTAPAAAPAVERFLGLAAAAPLSRAALETLAIIAYQQPVTRPQIEAVRGVNSDSVLKTLLSKGLIEEVGRTEGPGRPVLYATTPEFLQYFGLSALTDLPPLSLEQPPTLPQPEGDEILKG